MTLHWTAPFGRLRHWALSHWADVGLGALAAVGVMTAAHAALPPARAPVSQAAAPVRAQPAVPAEEAVLIAFQEPAPGFDVVSPFGLRQLPWEEGGRLHAGVDIAAPLGSPVVAAADGVVIRAGQSPSYGRFVEVRHAEGMKTLYAHLAAIAPGVRSGLALQSGDQLGQIGSSGTSTGAHLHFEVHDQAGRPLNPAMFLGRQFAEADDLPLRAARRIPRGLRIAHVSNIPASKRAIMQAKLERKTTARRAPVEVAASVPEATVDTAAVVPAPAVEATVQAASKVRIADDGRPQMTLQF